VCPTRQTSQEGQAQMRGTSLWRHGRTRVPRAGPSPRGERLLEALKTGEGLALLCSPKKGLSPSEYLLSLTKIGSPNGRQKQDKESTGKITRNITENQTRVSTRESTRV